MEKDKVCFTPWDENGNMMDRAKALYDTAQVLEVIEPGDKVAVKLHVGELGNQNYIRPYFVKQILDLVKERGGKPFLTDTVTYYPLKRTNAVDHMKTALTNGFGFGHFISADGLMSENKISMPSPDPVLEDVEVAGAIHQADAMIVVSHVKGHPLSGFGGAIKNLGMGCVSKKTKLEQHRLIDLYVDGELCQGCGVCAEACWFDLPRIENDKAVIDDPGCMRCPICSMSCPEGAISLQGKEKINKGLAVACKGVMDTFANNKTAFLNFAIDISVACDCGPGGGHYISENKGIFAGFSPLSIDAASLKSIDYEQLNREHNNDCWIQVKELEKLNEAGELDPDIVSV